MQDQNSIPKAPEDELQFIDVHSSNLGPTQSTFNDDLRQPGFDDPVGGAGAQGGFIRQSKHPTAAVFHYLFKVLAIVLYMFGTWFSSNFVFIFVLCVLCLAFDFWTVKNVSGRLLVGLRWWNNVKEDGTTEWRFESLEDMTEVSSADSRLFWLGMYGAPLAWLVVFIVDLLKLNFQWLIIVVVALTLNGANIVGYIKCSNDARQKLRFMVEDAGVKGAMSVLGSAGVRNALFGLLAGGAGAGAAEQKKQDNNRGHAYV